MKKMIITSILVSVYLLAFSQTNYKDIQTQVQDEIDAFYKKKVASGDIVSINDINNAKRTVNKDVKILTEAVNKMNEKSNEEIRISDKRELVEHFGDYSSSTLALINVITSSFEQNKIQSLILNLNNATNNELGFSLKERMNQMVEKLIVSKMGVKQDEASKVSGIINSIIENPVTKILGTAVPVINNVVNFIANLAIGNKKLTANDLKNFMEKVDEYFAFYELLAENNKSFQSNLYELSVKASALRLVLQNFIVDRIKIYYDGEISKDEISNLNKSMIEYLQQSKIKSRYSKLITDEKGTEKIPADIDKLETLKMPSTTVSQAQYLIDEIESLSNQYINAYRKYIISVNKSLDAAKTLKDADGKASIDTKVITDKQDDFLERLKSWEEQFKSSLNIVSIRDIVSQMTK